MKYLPCFRKIYVYYWCCCKDYTSQHPTVALEENSSNINDSEEKKEVGICSETQQNIEQYSNEEIISNINDSEEKKEVGICSETQQNIEQYSDEEIISNINDSEEEKQQHIEQYSDDDEWVTL